MKIKLLRENSSSSSQYFDRNMAFLKSSYRDSVYLPLIETFSPQNAPVLSQVLIDESKPFFSGVYGRVFSLSNGMMLKLFVSGVNLDADIARIKKSVDDVFAGSADINHMHYFDYGEIGDPVVFEKFSYMPKIFKFAVMPRIVPFKESRAYAMDRDIFNLFESAIIHLSYNSNNLDFYSFVELIANYVAKVFLSSTRSIGSTFYGISIESLSERISRFHSVIIAILRAAYEAYRKFGGIDLHFGNLGYFAQRPDHFFYFDM